MLKIRLTILFIFLSFFLVKIVYGNSDFKIYQKNETTVAAIFDSPLEFPFRTFIDSHVEKIENKLPFSYQEEKLRVFLNTFIIKTPKYNVLLDAGRGFGGATYFNLKELDLTPKDINYILLTHLHLEQVGGLIHEGNALYPEAQLFLAKKEYDYWFGDEVLIGATEKQQQEVVLIRRAVMAYKNRLNFLTVEEKFLGDFLPIFTFGHTPGHTAYLFSNKDFKLLFTGDIIYSLDWQIKTPEIGTVLDFDILEAILARHKILTKAAKNNYLLAPSYSQKHDFVKIKKDLNGYSFEYVLK